MTKAEEILNKHLSSGKIDTLKGLGFYDAIIEAIEEYEGEVSESELIENDLNIVDGCYGMYKLYQKGEFLMESEEKYCHKRAREIINKHK